MASRNKLRQLKAIAKEFKGKNVFLTGASMGLGRGFAETLAQFGASLFLCARSLDKLNETAEECRKRGAARVAVQACDVSQLDDCRSAVDACIEQFGHIDVLLLNAGISGSVRFDKISTEGLAIFEQMLRTNFLGNVYLAHFALPHLTKRASEGHKVRIVAISSISGIQGIPYRSAYCSSKHALQGFFNVLRAELAARRDGNMSVTLCCPQWIDTDIRSRHVVETQHGEYTKPATSGGSMLSVDDCVLGCLQAAANREREARFGTLYRNLPLLQALLPNFVDGLARKKTGIDAEIAAEEKAKDAAYAAARMAPRSKL